MFGVDLFWDISKGSQKILRKVGGWYVEDIQLLKENYK